MPSEAAMRAARAIVLEFLPEYGTTEEIAKIIDQEFPGTIADCDFPNKQIDGFINQKQEYKS